MTSQDPLLGPKEVAARLTVTPRALRYAVKQGKFPAPMKVCLADRWPASVVDQYLADQYQAATDATAARRAAQ